LAEAKPGVARHYQQFSERKIKAVSIPKEVKLSAKPRQMLKFDLENERLTIINYRQRIRQADAMGEYALGEVLLEIIAQEQEHLQDLADAPGIDTPKIE
jgi:bacterioferritin